MSEPSEEQSVVGGIVYPRPGRWLAKEDVSWPFAKVVVIDDQLVLGPRSRLARLVRPVTLRFDEIERIERQVAPRLLDHGIRIRFRLASPEIDRLQFWSWRPSMERLLAIFEDRGLEIKAVSWRDWMKT